jgi:hypothetical protein
MSSPEQLKVHLEFKGACCAYGRLQLFKLCQSMQEFSSVRMQR